mgnify:CR=1 FL=1
MAKKLEYSRKAVEDLTSIWRYTVKTWSEKQADEYYSKLISARNLLLSKSVVMSKKYDEIMPDLHGLHCGHHIIFYTIRPQGNILIVRIQHERMDFKRHFQQAIK